MALLARRVERNEDMCAERFDALSLRIDKATASYVRLHLSTAAAIIAILLTIVGFLLTHAPTRHGGYTAFETGISLTSRAYSATRLT